MKRTFGEKSQQTNFDQQSTFQLKKISHPTIKGENTQDLVVEKREQK